MNISDSYTLLQDYIPDLRASVENMDITTSNANQNAVSLDTVVESVGGFKTVDFMREVLNKLQPPPVALHRYGVSPEEALSRFGEKLKASFQKELDRVFKEVTDMVLLEIGRMSNDYYKPKTPDDIPFDPSVDPDQAGLAFALLIHTLLSAVFSSTQYRAFPLIYIQGFPFDIQGVCTNANSKTKKTGSGLKQVHNIMKHLCLYNSKYMFGQKAMSDAMLARFQSLIDITKDKTVEQDGDADDRLKVTMTNAADVYDKYDLTYPWFDEFKGRILEALNEHTSISMGALEASMFEHSSDAEVFYSWVDILRYLDERIGEMYATEEWEDADNETLTSADYENGIVTEFKLEWLRYGFSKTKLFYSGEDPYSASHFGKYPKYTTVSWIPENPVSAIFNDLKGFHFALNRFGKCVNYQPFVIWNSDNQPGKVTAGDGSRDKALFYSAQDMMVGATGFTVASKTASLFSYTLDKPIELAARLDHLKGQTTTTSTEASSSTGMGFGTSMDEFPPVRVRKVFYGSPDEVRR